MQLALECMRPFPEAYPLEMTASFTVAGSPYNYALLLPVSAASFFEALPTDKATYMSRWQSIEGPGTEAQQVFASAKPVDPALRKLHASENAPQTGETCSTRSRTATQEAR